MSAPKHIFVTGGVSSSLGKGILAASLAKLLQARGYNVTIQKFDPYINVDPGTLNPYEHGECFVTDDGAETDLDLGHYERFLNKPTSKANNVTTGQVYLNVIEAERRGEYLGKTVQVVPHITDEIKLRFAKLENQGVYDIIITEIGGTVGDIESLPYVEALRQFKYDRHNNGCLVVHLTYIPFLKGAGELKTKPTQHSVKTLLENGVQPDILVCRTEHHLPQDIRRKLALFCNVDANAVIEALDVDNIYKVPLCMKEEELDKVVLSKLKLDLNQEPELKVWRQFLNNLEESENSVKVALVGKYTSLPDAYKSIHESFIHAGAANRCSVKVSYINSEELSEDRLETQLSEFDGVLVAPGFGERGIEGKIHAIQYVREKRIPFLGICLGMQCAVVEFGRNVAGLPNAASTEHNPAAETPVIALMEEQKALTTKGANMRLGAYPCQIKKGTLADRLYKQEVIMERHRHRYEFNNRYLDQYTNSGMIASGINPITKLVEIVELPQDVHPFFMGVQYHPEYKSTVDNPHPIFVAFIRAAIEAQDQHAESDKAAKSGSHFDLKKA